jgi:hypothetical protein
MMRRARVSAALRMCVRSPHRDVKTLSIPEAAGESTRFRTVLVAVHQGVPLASSLHAVVTPPPA